MLGAVVMVALLGAEQKPKTKAPRTRVAEVIESREFRLVDSKGTMRGSWHADEDGSTTFAIFRNGKPELFLSLVEDGTASIGLGTTDKSHAVIALIKGERPVVSLKDAKGVINAGTAKSGVPSIEIRDPSDKVLFQSNR